MKNDTTSHQNRIGRGSKLPVNFTSALPEKERMCQEDQHYNEWKKITTNEPYKPTKSSTWIMFTMKNIIIIQLSGDKENTPEN